MKKVCVTDCVCVSFFDSTPLFVLPANPDMRIICVRFDVVLLSAWKSSDEFYSVG